MVFFSPLWFSFFSFWFFLFCSVLWKGIARVALLCEGEMHSTARNSQEAGPAQPLLLVGIIGGIAEDWILLAPEEGLNFCSRSLSSLASLAQGKEIKQ